MHFGHEWHPIQWALSFWICIHAENCTVFLTSRPDITEDRTQSSLKWRQDTVIIKVKTGHSHYQTEDRTQSSSKWRQDTVIISLLKRKSLLCQVAQGSVYFCYDTNTSWTKTTNGGAEYGAKNGLAPRSRYFLFTTKFYFLFFDASEHKELQLGKDVPLNEWVTRLRLLPVGAWGTEKRQGHLGVTRTILVCCVNEKGSTPAAQYQNKGEDIYVYSLLNKKQD
jgi:hypothetical protein